MFKLLRKYLLFQAEKRIAFLHAENKILRSKITAPIRLTPHQRQELVNLGACLGQDLKPLISIVTYETFLSWIRKSTSEPTPSPRPGRPSIHPYLQTFVTRLAKDNQWGYLRIFRECQKLGLQVSRSTIANILRHNNIAPLPNRPISWFTQLKCEFSTLIACDFFSRRLMTTKGIKTFFILFFINLHTRKIQLAGITRHPTEPWILSKLSQLKFNTTPHPRMLIRDRDTKFTKQFDTFFQDQGFKIYKTPPRSPNLNAYAESYIGRFKSECLNYFGILSSRQLRFIIKQTIQYFNDERPTPDTQLTRIRSPVKIDGIKSKSVLGGITHHYYWDEA